MEWETRNEEFIKWNALGRQFLEEKDLYKALACFTWALEIDPENPGAWNNKACVLGELAESEASEGGEAKELLEEALEYCERAIQLDPEDGEIWSNKGKILLLMGKKEEGLDCYDHSTLIDPDNPQLWLLRGLAYESNEYFANALRYYNKAVELEPGLREAWMRKYYLHARWDEQFDMLKCMDMLQEIDARRMGEEEEKKRYYSLNREDRMKLLEMLEKIERALEGRAAGERVEAVR